MPALFAYLIAVALLLGGGYGALNWLATPEPVKVVAKAKPAPPPPHYADDSGLSTPTNPPQASLSEAPKPEATSKPEANGADQAKTTSNEATSSNRPPPTSSLPQPQQPAAAGQQDAKAAAPQPDRPAQAEMPPAPADQRAAHAEAPVPGTDQDHSATAMHEEKQSAQAVSPGVVSPGTVQSAASTAPAAAAMTPKRSHVRQASRRSEKGPLEVMTLRIIELPDGRRMTQLVPYRSGNRYPEDGHAMAFDPDE